MSEAEGTVDTAYHEAGHAVALYTLGFDVGDVSIAADQDSVGRVDTPVPDVLADRLDILEYMGEDGKEFMRRQIIVVLSGVKAIEVLTGRVRDIDLDTLTESPGTDYSRLNLWLPMLAPPEGYQAVFDETQAGADRVLRENWNAVRAVAEALLEREEMDAAAVRSVLEDVGCVRDDAPIRRLLLNIEGDKLRERKFES